MIRIDRKKLDFPIALAQTRVAPGNIRQKLAGALKDIESAKKLGVKMIIFPELVLTDYMLGDRWENKAFLRAIERANDTMREASEGIVVIFGSVRIDWERIGEDGRVRKYNAAMIAQDGKWLCNGILCGWIPKTNHPKYRFFDDSRHFYPASKLLQEMQQKDRLQHLWQLLAPFKVAIDGTVYKIGLMICEDGWDDEYIHKPAKVYRTHNVDLLIDISQSPWTTEKWHARDEMLRRRVKDVDAPIIYVNSVGLQNNGKNLLWFDGNSCIIDENGEFRFRADQHKEGLWWVHLGSLPEPMEVRGHLSGIAEVHSAMIPAMREFFKPFKKVVIGLSGGIDSAVMLALLVEALGADRIIAVNMPTKFNSKTTQDAARLCAKNLGIKDYRVIPIQGRYTAQCKLLLKAGCKLNQLTRENIQSRIRGDILASIAQDEYGVVTNNGNKTEVALNYFTLYGDSIGAASFIGDLWKGQVYELGRFLNERAGRELIPETIFVVVPSAELSADQNVDEGKGDPIFYPWHDKLLHYWIVKRMDPEDVMDLTIKGTVEQELGCEAGTVAKYFRQREDFTKNLEWAWRQYHIEFKRVQLCPVFTVSRRSMGFDRRETIGDAYFTDEYYRLRDEYLKQAA